ncbi:MAG: membrane protein [Bellilinea sp.]|nr:MAG: membrane protein [Bellilinea sp.]
MTRKLLLLNGIAIIFAVYHHAIYWAITAINFWGHRFVSNATPQLLSSPNLFALFLRITDQIGGVAVPAFLFVSGYLYGFSLNRQIIGQSYRFILKRIYYLLIPYFVWSTLTVIFRIIEGENYPLARLIRVYLFGEADGPFYYVPLIVQLIVLSPFLFRAAKKYPLLSIGFVFSFQLLSTITWYFKMLNITPLTPLIFFNIFKSSYLFSHSLWFLMGSLFFIYRENIITMIKPLQRWTWLLLILLFISSQIEFQLLINANGSNWLNTQSSILTKGLYTLLILAYAVFGEKIPSYQKIEYIGANSYGIYLTHVIVIEIAARLLYHIFPYLLGQTVILLAVLVFMGITIPLALMNFSKKFSIKPLYSFMWG